jgi:hypothetical protein
VDLTCLKNQVNPVIGFDRPIIFVDISQFNLHGTALPHIRAINLFPWIAQREFASFRIFLADWTNGVLE